MQGATLNIDLVLILSMYKLISIRLSGVPYAASGQYGTVYRDSKVGIYIVHVIVAIYEIV